MSALQLTAQLRGALMSSASAAIFSICLPMAALAAPVDSYTTYDISTDPTQWDVDRYPTAGFSNIDQYEGRLDVLKMTTNPPASTHSFSQWEGYIQRTTIPAGNSFIGGDMWINPSWTTGNATDYVRTGMWGSALPESVVAGGQYVDSKASFPIMSFTNQNGVGRIEVWDTTSNPTTGWVELPGTADLLRYAGWNSLDMRLLPEEGKITYYLNGQLIYTWSNPSGDDGSPPEQFWAMYLKARNNGVSSFDTYWSNLLSGLFINGGEVVTDTPGDVVVGSSGGQSTSVAAGATIGGSISAEGDDTSPAVVNFAGDANIDDGIIGSKAIFNFSKDESVSTVIGGNVQLADASTTSGGTIANPIEVAGSVIVDDSSVFGGNWAVAGNVQSSGTLNPGNSIGVVAIGGNLSLNAGSTYNVEVNLAGESDVVNVGGVANLAGDVAVSAIDSYRLNHAYTILTAGGGFAGTQFSGATWNETGFLFLSPLLSYDTNVVQLTIGRNNVGFSTVAQSGNQTAVADALDSLSTGNGAFDAVARSRSASEARASLDLLSGDIHASTKSAIIESSRFVRNAAKSRIRAAFEVGAPTGSPVIAYGPGGATTAPATTDRFALWTQGYGSWGDWDANGNASKLNRDIGGFIIGGDAAVSDHWRLGLLAGYGHSTFDSRSSSAESNNYDVALYGGGQWGNLGLRGGVAYTKNEIETLRSLKLSGYSDSLSADYNADTTQVFTEAGYAVNAGPVNFEPFAGLAYVSLDTDGFTENGGDAALSSDGDNSSTTFSTLGLRASSRIPIGSSDLTVRGLIGWGHAYDDIGPETSLRFLGGNSFTVSGVPIAKDVAILEAGIEAALTKSISLGVSYNGQISSASQDHGVKADLNWKF